ncbi:MAG: rhomboid family intramembrane serine protease, partial [Acidobacteriota bacterium]|nr:rhomboid family intramembrane serine protease [Acidobacteriota bacterium]
MASEHEHDTHYRIEHDPTPDQSTAVEAGAKRSPSLLDAPATYGLLFLNLLWFAAMLRSGPYIADWHMHRFGSLLTDSFSIEALSFFGGCDASLVLQHGQWIRVVTAAFIHMNPLHLLVNMWCLWNLGLLGEPLLGRRGLVAVY